MGKCKTTVMEKLNVDWKQTETTTETDHGMLLNENGNDKQAADEDSELRPSRSNKTFCCTVYLDDNRIRSIPFTFFISKRKIA
jgi:hypothetical protein